MNPLLIGLFISLFLMCITTIAHMWGIGKNPLLQGLWDGLMIVVGCGSVALFL